jgi:hypothetical protein
MYLSGIPYKDKTFTKAPLSTNKKVNEFDLGKKALCIVRKKPIKNTA